jgi:sorbitol-6-phosphate 2-dehydrogenase
MTDIHGGDKHHQTDHYRFWPTDISSASEVNHTVEQIIQQYGRIDGLVNNAGVNFPRLLVDEKPRPDAMNSMKPLLKKW